MDKYIPEDPEQKKKKIIKDLIKQMGSEPAPTQVSIGIGVSPELEDIEEEESKLPEPRMEPMKKKVKLKRG